MQNLIKHELFEMEVLDRLNSGKLLANLVFTNGTMLRLCFGLNRFSIDLDFLLFKKTDNKKLFNQLKACFSKFYLIKKSLIKPKTMFFEVRSEKYSRSLKIEIKKEIKKIKTETAIAYRKYSNIQVFLKIISLEKMMQAKIAAFLDAKEIRDCFDIEFLFKKGIALKATDTQLKNILKNINSLTQNDYSVKLRPLLEDNQKEYYMKENFKILKLAINERLADNIKNG